MTDKLKFQSFHRLLSKKHKRGFANSGRKMCFKPQSGQLLYSIIAVEFVLFALFLCCGDSLGKWAESYFVLTALQQLDDNGAFVCAQATEITENSLFCQL